MCRTHRPAFSGSCAMEPKCVIANQTGVGISEKGSNRMKPTNRVCRTPSTFVLPPPRRNRRFQFSSHKRLELQETLLAIPWLHRLCGELRFFAENMRLTLTEVCR